MVEFGHPMYDVAAAGKMGEVGEEAHVIGCAVPLDIFCKLELIELPSDDFGIILTLKTY